jgi:uncharacterized protein (TIGR02569 family)
LVQDPVVESRPDSEVLAEFGAEPGPLQRLDGGQGTTWIVGDLVVKPVGDVAEAEWVGAVLCDLPERGFRLSRPVQSRTGRWTVAGWSAWSRVDGCHDVSTRWDDVLAAGEALHGALREVSRPDFLDARDNVWVEGERAAWDDDAPRVLHTRLAPLAEQLAAFRTPHRGPEQIVHGDLTGNVLFAEPLDPAIIDFTPYWRPVGFASAVVVADAIAWHGASPALTDALSDADDSRSMLARAALFRLITCDRAALSRGTSASAYLRENLAAHSRILEALRAM